LDPLLARHYSRVSGGDRLAREVSEGATVLLDSAVRLAFLGGVRRPYLGSCIVWHHHLVSWDREEALIEKCVPQNIARW
jgi:hypothetical protein